ncbi:MAG: YtxH domain-containing protein [bacterium]|nr:YtxH domain-containing protein [bacterium]
MSKKSFIKGAIFGAAVGSILALLYAPKSGQETRADIALALKKAREEIDDRVDQLKKAASNIKGQSGEEVEKLLTKAQKLKEELTQRAAEVSRKGGEMSKVAKEKLKKLANEVGVAITELETEIAMIAKEQKSSKNTKNSPKVVKLNVKS